MEAMMITSGFEKPPFIFKGRQVLIHISTFLIYHMRYNAMYQIHLVKADAVRPFIPKEFRIVETLGYTVGGFFLANYEDSPFGAFDELVVIAGIVRNDRSSCAWAAKVLVNSDEARDHGQKANVLCHAQYSPSPSF
ncbi:hypothetical protein Pfo_030877 [Paulownia fortunei]|nr:hypothetical protein Pfo_030877 [Paulownia fortunei]